MKRLSFYALCRRAWDTGASCQVPLRPETMAQTVSQNGPYLARYRRRRMAQNGTRATGPRCIALVGPFQSGKTTLLEAILARTGAIQRQDPAEAEKVASATDTDGLRRYHQRLRRSRAGARIRLQRARALGSCSARR